MNRSGELANLEADFVVVGAGSSGCVLAARLSENAKYSVILLEAGPSDRNRWIHVPWGFGRLFAHPELNWCYRAEPDAGLHGRQIFWPRGRVLGGSSAINGMIYVRGQKEDFDLWRQMGNTGWSFEDVLPYFKRAEDQSRGESEYHGTGGPLRVSDVRPDALCDAFIGSAIERGFALNDDFNGSTQEGVGYHQATIRRGRRVSTATAYLAPAAKRSNLRILTEARAERIVFENRQASGVIVAQHGRSIVIKARREVLLCGGAIESPKLLLLSGVGPEDQLRALGIQVVHDLKGVGSDLQDHYSAALKLRSKLGCTLNDAFSSPLARMRASLQYALLRTGPLASPVVSVGLFARTRPSIATPDVKCSFSPFSTDRPQDGLHEWSGFSLLTFQLRPQSRGSVKLRSTRVDDAPMIHPNYLSAAPDRETIVAALKLCREIVGTRPISDLVAAEYLPGREVRSDDELLGYARQYGTTVFHPTSTCRMGNDPMAVVDPGLNVRNLSHLRVVDASIMPAVPSGNTNAPTIMIAERAADMILSDQQG